MYVYKAKVVSVYDGDTFRANIDLGFNTWLFNQKIRIAAINAPEIKGEEREQGLATKEWLLNNMPVGTEIVITTIRDRKEKYGRWLAYINIPDKFENVGETLIQLGLAERYA